MKAFLVGFLVILFCATSFATSTDTFSFRGYSSATGTNCTVWGMKKIPGAALGGIQVFTPDPALSRTLALGTKGFANYSASMAVEVYYSCTVGTTSVNAPVKIFLNEVETNVLTTQGIGFLGVNP
jgi:hypothetical protein